MSIGIGTIESGEVDDKRRFALIHFLRDRHGESLQAGASSSCRSMLLTCSDELCASWG